MTEIAEPNHVSLDILVRGAQKIFDNAESLFGEATILAESGATERAVCLHQISLEECSKVENLGAWAVSLINGDEVDEKKVLAAFARHSAKNKSNAYMLEPSAEERDAQSRGDWKAALDAFKKTQAEFHSASNWAKNASLYVDWSDGKFVAPSERITKEMLVEIAARNAEFLRYADNGLRMLKRLEKSPEEIKELLLPFMKQVEALRHEMPRDLADEFGKLLDDFLERGKSKLRKK
jgi:AbiV family abortive infection protein